MPIDMIIALSARDVSLRSTTGEMSSCESKIFILVLAEFPKNTQNIRLSDQIEWRERREE